MRSKLVSELEKLSMELEAMKRMEAEKSARIELIKVELAKREIVEKPIVEAAPAKKNAHHHKKNATNTAVPAEPVETKKEEARTEVVHAQVSHHKHHHHKA